MENERMHAVSNLRERAMKKIVLTYGLISGVVISVLMLATFPLHDALGPDNSMAVGYATMVAAFLLVYFGVRRYRDTVGGGTISFGRAFQVGALIALIGSLCYVATWEVMYFGGWTSDYFEKYTAQMVTKWQAEGKPQAEIDKEVAELAVWAERYKNPAINAAITFLEPLPVALLMSLLTAGILRRREPLPT